MPGGPPAGGPGPESGPDGPEQGDAATMSTAAGMRRRRAVIAGVVAVTVLAVTGGVLAASMQGSGGAGQAPAGAVETQPAATTSPAAAPSPDQESSAPGSAAPHTVPEAAPEPSFVMPTDGGPHSADLPAGWQQYSNPAAGVSFDLPAGWRVVENSVDGSTPHVVLDVLDATGATAANFSYSNGGLGGACGPDTVPVLTLDSVPVDVPHRSDGSPASPAVSYRVLDATGIGGKAVGAIGLVKELPDESGEACMLYTTMSGERAILSFASRLQIGATDQPGPGRDLIFDSVADAEAFIGTAAYQDLMRMFTSLELRPMQ